MPGPDLTPDRVADLLAAALEKDRLQLALQPVVEAASGRLAFCEALLRLHEPDGTVIAASDFIEQAERVGLVDRLDRRALELTVALLAGHPRLRLSLNVSGLTAGDSRWTSALRSAIAATPGLAARLMIEITETARVPDLDALAAFVTLVRAEGCRVAIDDFGAGYTSYRHLKTLDVDVLKIAGLFVKDLASDQRSRVLVKSMIALAEDLGLETVAEEVCDEASAAFLRSVGATYLQGFLYGAPTPADDLTRRRGLL